MEPTRLFLVAGVMGLAGALSLAANEVRATPWSNLPRHTRVGLCVQRSADHEAARQAYNAFAQRVRSLRPDAPMAPVARAMDQLLALPCFRLAMENPRAMRFDSALSLRQWWDDGGEEWLLGYLDGPAQGAAPAPHTVILPPDPRPTLALENHAQHALAPILCSLADADCGRETQGWLLRANDALREHASDDERRFAESNAERRDPVGRCMRDSASGPADARYMRLRRCLEAYTIHGAGLPAGRFRAPREGWFVIRGRRGHYQFCDEVRAYDLATGSAYVAQSCSGLVLSTGGSVNVGQTDASRRVRTEAGVMPVDNLREAALMAFLSSEMDEHHQYRTRRFTVPAEVTPQWIHDPLGGLSTMGMGSSWGSSAQTRLSWSWVDNGRVRAQGTLTWPDSAHGGEDHTDSLLRVAEAGIAPGCVHASLPANFTLGNTPGGVSGIDATPESLRAAQGEMVRALTSMQGIARCGAAGSTTAPGSSRP